MPSPLLLLTGAGSFAVFIPLFSPSCLQATLLTNASLLQKIFEAYSDSSGKYV